MSKNNTGQQQPVHTTTKSSGASLLCCQSPASLGMIVRPRARSASVKKAVDCVLIYVLILPVCASRRSKRTCRVCFPNELVRVKQPILPNPAGNLLDVKGLVGAYA